MKKLLPILAFALAITAACESDTNTPNESFFNLETGNLWVYKRYNSVDGINFTASGRIDSVSITGTTTIDGFAYAVRHHKVYNNGNLLEEYDEHLREDAIGHLVMPSGFVVHPGLDPDYTAIRPILVGEETIGNINYHTGNPFSASVEGQSYYVYPYIGDYTPLVDDGQDKFIYDYYQDDLGLVCQHCAAVFGPGVYQDRLIGYQLN